jgi:hypothetical protein
MKFLNFMKGIVTLLFLMVYHHLSAQHQELNESPEVWKGKKHDTTNQKESNLLQAFKKGHASGHFRYFFMHTDNQANLLDYYANAVGGGLKFETAKFHNFQFGVSGFYIFNLMSSDFGHLDPNTNAANRYEIGLFDINDVHNRFNLDRLEELYLKYNFKSSRIILGKQLINTPFVNLQDGRMRPTEVSALWSHIQMSSKLKLEGGFILQISPRSTLEYMSIARSIGVYPSGLNIDGKPSNYKDNLSSKGIFHLGINAKVSKKINVQLWDLVAENIFHSIYFESNFKHALSPNHQLDLGFQSIFQHALNNGGNDSFHKTYYPTSEKGLTFGGRVGIKHKRYSISANYNRITSQGRYLMPREWGRDPFYTFLPRERNEGFGDVNAIVLKSSFQPLKSSFKYSLGIGYFDLPDVTNFRLNKYGMPSYYQINADVRYHFKGELEGFDLQVLWANKINASSSILENKFIINKVNMSNLNVILNFHF